MMEDFYIITNRKKIYKYIAIVGLVIMMCIIVIMIKNKNNKDVEDKKVNNNLNSINNMEEDFYGSRNNLDGSFMLGTNSYYRSGVNSENKDNLYAVSQNNNNTNEGNNVLAIENDKKNSDEVLATSKPNNTQEDISATITPTIKPNNNIKPIVRPTKTPSMGGSINTGGNNNFKVQLYDIVRESDCISRDLVVNLKGTEYAYVEGAFCYTDSVGNYVKNAWSRELNRYGKGNVNLDLPLDATDAKLEIWWAEYYDEYEDIDKVAECSMLKYNFK